MADDTGDVWRTIGGRRVLIKAGQDLKTAMKESGKFKNIFGQDTSEKYLKEREVKQVDTVEQMKKGVDDYVKQVKTDDIRGIIHTEELNDYGEKVRSFSEHYGSKDIKEFIGIYKNNISYITLSSRDENYDYKKNKVEINLHKK